MNNIIQNHKKVIPTKSGFFFMQYINQSTQISNNKHIFPKIGITYCISKKSCLSNGRYLPLQETPPISKPKRNPQTPSPYKSKFSSKPSDSTPLISFSESTYELTVLDVLNPMYETRLNFLFRICINSGNSCKSTS